MKKTLIILTAFAITSCGTIKKNKQSVTDTQKNDLNASKIDYKRFRDSSFILKPFDATRPMIIGKDTIVNTIIENHYRDRVHIVKDTIHKTDTKIVEVESKVKETDNTKVYLYLIGFGFFFIALIVIVCFWIISRKFSIK